MRDCVSAEEEEVEELKKNKGVSEGDGERRKKKNIMMRMKHKKKESFEKVIFGDGHESQYCKEWCWFILIMFMVGFALEA